MLVVAHLAFGGRDYRPAAARDPCRPTALRAEGDPEARYERLGLATLDRAACRLEVPRAQLALGLLNRESLDDFTRTQGVSEGEVERAVRDGARETIDEAEQKKVLEGPILSLLRSAVAALPLRRLVDAVNGTSDPCAEPEWRRVEGDEAVYAQVALIGLDQASCRLRVSPEQFALALGDDAALERFQEQHGIDDRELDEAVRAGLRRGLDEGDEGGQIGGLDLLLLRQVIDRVSFQQLLGILRSGEISF